MTPPGVRRAIAVCILALSGCSSALPALTFSAGPGAEPLPAVQRSAPDDPYLVRLRAEHALDAVVAGAGTDLDRVRRLSAWTRSRWDHNGFNEPSAPDPLTILAEAAAGQRFRCVEYAVVLAGALNAVGVPARVLGLKTADVETRALGAGHVVAEAYLADLGRWVMVDGQFDFIPVLDGEPLSALDLQGALATRPGDVAFERLSEGGISPGRYRRFIGPYLYYFDVRLDQRYTAGGDRDRRLLTLGPVGAPMPTVFQRTSPMGPQVYTHSAAAFYAAPAL